MFHGGEVYEKYNKNEKLILFILVAIKLLASPPISVTDDYMWVWKAHTLLTCASYMIDIWIF